ncbi:hypothetical protein Q763_01545 [Flavobacterium beibuense F44-8]|uniref:HTH cro/C1-type domain-containing protein n=1 Tax=Flavobacterium beibuense F44-8 TaxID=1406840 RepID=A0A0A2LZ05_9FLAO|nr:helix-turn-helix transcriptional regulator [Flavobacterium beibuense]KGO84453.1 hypothetical protein Q763_01545 [Flavobacterium beibuense F44-8]
MKNYIGLNIKYLCDKNFLSQREFGAIFNITQAVVNAYIKGKSNPQIDTIQKICTHFELMIDDFINKDLNAAQYTQKEVPAQKQHVSATNEQNTPYNHEKDALIAALRETIDTQRELIATLRSRLDNTQTKAS